MKNPPSSIQNHLAGGLSRTLLPYKGTNQENFYIPEPFQEVLSFYIPRVSSTSHPGGSINNTVIFQVFYREPALKILLKTLLYDGTENPWQTVDRRVLQGSQQSLKSSFFQNGTPSLAKILWRSVPSRKKRGVLEKQMVLGRTSTPEKEPLWNPCFIRAYAAGLTSKNQTDLIIWIR